MEAWNTEADRQFPHLDVEVRAASEADMFGNGTNSVFLDIRFDDFGNLKANEAALAAFEEHLRTEANVDHIDTEAVPTDDAEASAALQADTDAAFPHVARAESSIGYLRIDGSWVASVRVRFFVASAHEIDPRWLADAADREKEVAAAHGGTFGGMSLADASELERLAANPNLQAALVPASAIDALADASEDGCLREGDWAFDVSSTSIDAYPARAPGGACA